MSKPTSKTQAELIRIKYGIDLLEEIGRGSRRDINVINDLVRGKADLGLMDRDGNTALNLIMMWGNRDLIKLMVENGADVNHRGAEGKTPLHVAMDVHSKKTIKVLFELGADPYIKDDKGIGPVEFVRNCGSNDFADEMMVVFNTLSADKKEAAAFRAVLRKGLPVEESFRPLKPIKLRQGA